MDHETTTYEKLLANPSTPQEQKDFLIAINDAKQVYANKNTQGYEGATFTLSVLVGACGSTLAMLSQSDREEKMNTLVKHVLNVAQEAGGVYGVVERELRVTMHDSGMDMKEVDRLMDLVSGARCIGPN